MHNYLPSSGASTDCECKQQQQHHTAAALLGIEGKIQVQFKEENGLEIVEPGTT